MFLAIIIVDGNGVLSMSEGEDKGSARIRVQVSEFCLEP